MRYVIDFYFDESRAGSPDAFTVDARPAVDDLSSALDRTKMGVRFAVACGAAASLLADARERRGWQVYVWCLRLGLPCPFTKMPSFVAPKAA